MTNQEHYMIGGRDIESAPYHYTECGLEDVYLLNGFVREEYDGEEYVSVENVDSLWKAIGLNLVCRQKTLAPKEVKFLRLRMDMTQAELAAALRVTDQTVARWEKGRGKDDLPGPADVALRFLFLASDMAQPEGGKILQKMHKMISEMVETDDDCLPASFAMNRDGLWAEAA